MLVERHFVMLVVLFLLLIVCIVPNSSKKTIFANPDPHSGNNPYPQSYPITIVGNIGPISYEDGTLKIQYIGYPFVPFRNV